jgi:hypothetical protein
MGTMYGGSGLWDATVGFGVCVSFYMCGIRSGFWYCLYFCVCVNSERSKMSPTLYSGSVQWDTNYCYSGCFGFCHLGCVVRFCPFCTFVCVSNLNGQKCHQLCILVLYSGIQTIVIVGGLVFLIWDVWCVFVLFVFLCVCQF